MSRADGALLMAVVISSQYLTEGWAMVLTAMWASVWAYFTYMDWKKP